MLSTYFAMVGLVDWRGVSWAALKTSLMACVGSAADAGAMRVSMSIAARNTINMRFFIKGLLLNLCHELLYYRRCL